MILYYNSLFIYYYFIIIYFYTFRIVFKNYIMDINIFIRRIHFVFAAIVRFHAQFTYFAAPVIAAPVRMELWKERPLWT